MKFRKKPVSIEAITFDELVAYGRANGGNIINGMPWSFDYMGHHVSHENDNCYLIPTLEGTMNMTRGDMLITGVKGEIYPCKLDIFIESYDTVVCGRCDGSGKAIGADRPFESSGPGSYPGPCPVCNGLGRMPS